MTDPIRWRDDPSAPEELRELMGAKQAPPPLPMVEKNRLRGVVMAGGVAASFLWLKVALAAVTLGSVGVGVWAGLGAVKPAAGEGVPKERTPERGRPAEEAVDGLGVMEEERADPAEPTVDPQEQEIETAATSMSPSRRRGDGAAGPLEGADALAEEVRLLERARSLLETNARAAFRAAEQSRRRFPEGQLREERELIAVEALVRLDRHRQATRRARALIARNPNGLHARRARRLIEEGQ